MCDPNTKELYKSFSNEKMKADKTYSRLSFKMTANLYYEYFIIYQEKHFVY